VNILNALKQEQKKLAMRLERIRGAITALGGKKGRGKRKMSAAVKRRISAAQKRNWAKKRVGK
jgi:DNA-binding FrmR family transcriptional regulator